MDTETEILLVAQMQFCFARDDSLLFYFYIFYKRIHKINVLYTMLMNVDTLIY